MQRDTDVRGQKLLQPNNSFLQTIKLLLLYHISPRIYFCSAPDPGRSGCKGERELLDEGQAAGKRQR